MGDDVIRVVGACMPCARVKAGFKESHHESPCHRMVLCDVCNVEYHIWCVTPSFDTVPEGRWTCQRHAVG